MTGEVALVPLGRRLRSQVERNDQVQAHVEAVVNHQSHRRAIHLIRSQRDSEVPATVSTYRRSSEARMYRLLPSLKLSSFPSWIRS